MTASAGQLAEAAALGAALWSSEAARSAVEHLDPSMFTREGHRVVFDPITLSDRLVETGRIDVAGGFAAPFDLFTVETCSTPSAWRTYVDLVVRDHDRRCQVRDHLRALRQLGVEVEEQAVGLEAA